MQISVFSEWKALCTKLKVSYQGIAWSVQAESWETRLFVTGFRMSIMYKPHGPSEESLKASLAHANRRADTVDWRLAGLGSGLPLKI